MTPGVIPHLLQWDERWGYQIYGDNLIAVNGCGPTVISMVAAGLTGDNTVTPYKVAKFAEQNGYYEGDAGTSWALMTEGAAQFGIHGKIRVNDPNSVKRSEKLWDFETLYTQISNLWVYTAG